MRALVTFAQIVGTTSVIKLVIISFTWVSYFSVRQICLLSFYTAQKMRYPSKDFFNKNYQIRRNLSCFLNCTNRHCVKSVQMQSFFWSVFSRIRTEYGDLRRISPIHSKYGKKRTRKNSVF